MEFTADNADEMKQKLEAACTLAEDKHEITLEALCTAPKGENIRKPVPFRNGPEAWGDFVLDADDVRTKYAGSEEGDVVLDGVAQFRITID